MTVAIVHEWWAKFGGGETVSREIATQFSESELWTLYYDRNVNKELISDLKIHQSWLSKIPFHENRKLAASLAPLAYRTMSRTDFTCVISSSHTFAHTVKFSKSPDATYLSYIHSPSRVIWSPEIDTRASRELNLLRSTLQVLDKSLGKHVVGLAANSTEVASRIEKYWEKSAVVIHPPVEIDFDAGGNDDLGNRPFPNQEYLISAGRFVQYKNHDFSIEVSRYLNIPLVIMGSGPLEAQLRVKAEKLGAEVHFEIEPDNRRWKFLLKNAMAMLFPVHEDFGITPIESISCGTPVYALGKGGALDYIVDGVNGWLIPELNVVDFGNAISRHSELSQVKLRQSITKFSREEFRNQIKNWVSLFGDFK